MNIGLEKIRIDCGTQSREAIDEEVVEDYAESMRNGSVFPPAIVFNDGINLYLADGFHRYFACKKVGSPGMECTILTGTLRDAKFYSYTKANKGHGLRPNNADKRKIVIAILSDIEWSEWSDREIAKECGFSHTFVANVRREMGMKKEETKFKRDGKELTQTAKIKTAKEDKKQEEEQPPEEWPFKPPQDEEMADAIALLKAENEALSDKLAVASMDADEAAKQMAESTIKELRAQIRLLEIELAAVKQSRDTFQAENAQLMKQCASLQKKIKKLEEK